MLVEHTRSFDSDMHFTSHKQKKTTPSTEWNFVLTGDCSYVDMGKNRVARDVDDLARIHDLRKEEIIAVVLYTGPMVRSIACALAHVYISADCSSADSFRCTTLSSGDSRRKNMIGSKEVARIRVAICT